jgi:hypothetical protein
MSAETVRGVGARIFGALRDGSWLTPTRLRVYPVALALQAALFLIVSIWVFESDLPVGSDFVATWAADRVAVERSAGDAYDSALIAAAEREAVGPVIWYDASSNAFSYFPFPYPPTYLLLTEPLGHLPYFAALAVWTLLGAGAFLFVVTSLTGRRGVLIALAFPAVVVNVAAGQNGLILAALLASAFALLRRRPYAAGVMIGLMAIKPQTGLLIPIALLAGGYWRPFLAAAVTVLGLTSLSVVAFGIEPWRGFIAMLGFYQAVLLNGQGLTVLAKIVSVLAYVRHLGGGLSLAYVAQGAVTIFAATCTFIMWRNDVPLPGKKTVLVLASLLATPYLFDYDLALLAPAIAVAAVHGMESGFLPWEKSALALLWLLPAIARLVTAHAAAPVVPIVLLLYVTLLMGGLRQGIAREADAAAR